MSSIGSRLPNYRIHLTRRAVMAPAEKHRRQDHLLGLPGPRRPLRAGDAHVRRSLASTLLTVEELHMRIRVIVAATAVFALLGLFQVDAIFVGRAAAQTEPTLFQPGPGGAPLPPNRDVCWSEPPDLDGYLVASDYVPGWGLEVEVANDFAFEADRTIGRVRWWGGYYQTPVPCEAGLVATGFNLRFYDSANCLPDPPYYGYPIAEFIIVGNAGETSVGCQQGLYPLFRYEADVNLSVVGGEVYWFGAQLAANEGPSLWGRLAASTVTGCESAFGVNQLQYWDWMHLSDVLGFALDVSQEFECDAPVAVQQSSWGRIRALYR